MPNLPILNAKEAENMLLKGGYFSRVAPEAIASDEGKKTDSHTVPSR